MNYKDLILNCPKNVLNFSKNNIIIKKKKIPLDITINLNKYNQKMHIYIDDEMININNKKIAISNLKTIYIGTVEKYTWIKTSELWKNRYAVRRPIKSFPVLKFVINGCPFEKKIILNKTSTDDYKKIAQLFDYFIFSNEICSGKMESSDYNLILSKNCNVKYDFQKYPIPNSSKKTDNTMIINNREYQKIATLPKKYYKKYLNKRYILCESIIQNPDYFDVWADYEKHEEYNKKKHDLKNKIVLTLIIVLTVLIGIGFIIESFFEYVYK